MVRSSSQIRLTLTAKCEVNRPLLQQGPNSCKFGIVINPTPPQPEHCRDRIDVKLDEKGWRYRIAQALTVSHLRVEWCSLRLCPMRTNCRRCWADAFCALGVESGIGLQIVAALPLMPLMVISLHRPRAWLRRGESSRRIPRARLPRCRSGQHTCTRVGSHAATWPTPSRGGTAPLRDSACALGANFGPPGTLFLPLALYQSAAACRIAVSNV